jgi:hypothetical protein
LAFVYANSFGVGVVALALTQFDYGLGVFVIVGLWISTFAATQDIAIDGYTVETFSESEYRLGSMAQSIGVALAVWLVEQQLYGCISFMVGKLH